MRNPFARKRKSPIEQAFDAIDDARSDAADIAATVRDAASRAADVLGDATPDVRGKRLPLIAVVAAAGIAIALVVRSRVKGSEDAPGPVAYTPPSVQTAAKSTTASSAWSGAADASEPKAAAKTEPEEPREPQAETAESEAAAK